MIININKYRSVILSIIAVFILIIIGWFSMTNYDKPEEAQFEPGPPPIWGEMLVWKDVNKMFPKNSEATVIDVDSHLSFRVQRRGGSSHVDVQPLTAEDSAIMKTIYQGKWSWQRKAVFVQLDNGKLIAGSMNGMPHGQGAIDDNDFDGHFCIHFKDSKTHGSGKVDVAHQMMIWKAANLVEQQLQTLKPAEMLAVFFAAIDQKEYNIASKLIDPEINSALLADKLERINKIKVDAIKETAANTLSVSLRIVYTDSNQECRDKIVINTTNEAIPYWKVTEESVTSWLDKDTQTVLQVTSGSIWATEDWEE